MTELEGRIRTIIAAELQIGEDFLTGDVTIEDLGFDSLTSAEVLLAIEKQLGQPLDSARLMESLTPDTRIDELITAVAAAAMDSAPAAEESSSDVTHAA